MNSLEQVLKIRDFFPEDTNFILNSWLMSFQNKGSVRYVEPSIYFANQEVIIKNILAKADVKIACDSNRPDDVFGYIVCEKIGGLHCTHYCYVKELFRNMGIAKALASDVGLTFETASVYTHQTKTASLLQDSHKLVYHPFLLNPIITNHLSKQKESGCAK